VVPIITVIPAVPTTKELTDIEITMGVPPLMGPELGATERMVGGTAKPLELK
jgi:hypothetical protein